MLRALALHATALAVPFGMALAQGALADPGHRVTGPFTHDNLAVYLVHGKSTDGPVPLTLQEALAEGKAVVHETGNVSRLEVENTSDEEVFIQAGDIVKGGQQDRVLTVSLLLAPRSGRFPIGAYCVEQGRWAARGREDVKRFASADKAIPSREAKLALMGLGASSRDGAARELQAGNSRTVPPAQGADRIEDRERIIQQQRRAGGEATAQGEVWSNVAKTQRKLSENLQAAVSARESATSLQLSLENQRLAEARRSYLDAIKPVGEKESDVIGLVVAINGKLSGAELYPSNGLFRKMWLKQLDASATEAIGEKSAARDATTVPSADAVLAFLADAEKGKSTTTRIDPRLTREAREAEKALLVETKRLDGLFVHRSYLAR